MRSIAAAAVFSLLTATAWADELKGKSATTDEPIVLSEEELDAVSAGRASGVLFNSQMATRTQSTNDAAGRMFDSEFGPQWTRSY